MKVLRRSVPFLLAGAFLLLFFYAVPPGELIKSLKKIDPVSLTLSFVLYLFSQITRTLKWKLLIGFPFGRLLLINAVNVFLNNVLPARTGEISWIYYAKKEGASLSVSVGVLLLNRLYDLLGLLSFFLISLSFYLGSSFLLLLSLSGILLLFFILPSAVGLLPELSRIREAVKHLKTAVNLRTSLLLGILSTLTYAFKFSSLLIVALLFIEADPLKILVGLAGGEVSTVLPVHSFMGYGTYEAAFLIPLKLLGEGDLKEILKTGFLVHNLLLLYSTSTGVVSLLVIHHSRR